MARFCHLIHIITRVSLFYGGGKLILPVTVSSCLRLLSFSAGFLPPCIKVEVLRQLNPSLRFQENTYQRHKSRCPLPVKSFPSLMREHISATLWFFPSRISARTEQRESKCLRNPRPPTNLARGVRRLGIWGVISRLLIHAADVFFLVIARGIAR
jgi:hypothetical protein